MYKVQNGTVTKHAVRKLTEAQVVLADGSKEWRITYSHRWFLTFESAKEYLLGLYDAKLERWSGFDYQRSLFNMDTLRKKREELLKLQESDLDVKEV